MSRRVLLVIALITSATPAAASDTATATAAQALFDDAVARMKAHDFAAACPKLEEVTRMIPDAIGAKVELATCYEQANRLASAWSEWSAVEALARRAGQSERMQKAGARARALRPTLSTLTLNVHLDAAAPPGLTITRDGLEVGRAQWGAPIPVDGGEHEVRAEAPGRRAFRAVVHVAPTGQAASLEVPSLADDPAAASPADNAHRAPPRADEPLATEGSSWRAPVGIATTAVGGASLVLGAVLGGMAIAKKNRSDERECDAATNVCTQAGLDVRASALHLATGSTTAFIVGGVLVAGGIVLWTTAPARRDAASGPRARLEVGAANLSLHGTF